MFSFARYKCQIIITQGWTTEVHDHILKVVPDEMTYDEVEALAGSKVAVFCKDYTSMYATVTPVTKQRRGTTYII